METIINSESKTITIIFDEKFEGKFGVLKKQFQSIVGLDDYKVIVKTKF